ncbi:MAG: NAD-dependent epimerase/dehydratase family protein [Gemmataceae bacterium]|nr:NAD-dependent epimerase/dehydratase family protein [Gemmataceae bacterium]
MKTIADVDELEQLLSEPTQGVIDALRRLDGDIVLLGVGGKMGPTMARMAKRASELAGNKRRVIGVSRFSSPNEESSLQRHGVDTIRCDLLDEAAVARLPDAPNVVFMTGMKFGSTGQESLTWAMNAYMPSIVCKKYRASRIVAFSTGNVYGLVPVAGGGSREGDPPSPVGEYAMSCLGRERMFEHFSGVLGIPMAIIRLNYACELRYGVLVDLALHVWREAPIDLGMGHFNILWQGDANAISLQAFEAVATPPALINVTGPELLSVRQAAERLGGLMRKTPRFIGHEGDTALLSNARPALDRFGPPRVSAEQLTAWVADWVRRDGPTLGKPTHFESREGKF